MLGCGSRKQAIIPKHRYLRRSAEALRESARVARLAACVQVDARGVGELDDEPCSMESER